ncbi:hypothetical protein VDGE_09737 [Verticillium dahliae]|uniref:Major facilitator superfamily (MFS) profile domain-containing protein n=1 Tax=Verticillium dahliae TaxID=27337 RepID=A0A444RPY5_VERDA|nr:hypothetical protein VDGE_09737 [Verticillium dahliae]
MDPKPLACDDSFKALPRGPIRCRLKNRLELVETGRTFPVPLDYEPSRDAPSASGSRQSADVEKRATAWLCVAGSFLFLMPSFGMMQSVGVIQAYLQLNVLEDYSARDVGWITGMYTFLSLFLGIQVGPLMDRYGSRRLAPVAVVLTIPTFFLLGECTEYWHFMLCLGLLGGLGSAVASTVAIAVVGKLFVRYRGLAMGLALTGSSVGAVIFPLMLRSVLPSWGWQWSMRGLGFVITGMMVPGVGCLYPFPSLMGSMDAGVLAANTDSTARPAQPKRNAALNFTAFNSPPFSFVTGAFFMLEFVIFGVTGILPTLVTWAGFPAETGYNLIAIMNGFSFVGRLLPGAVGDRLGHLNVLLVMTVFTFVSTGVTLLPFGARHIEALYAFSACWGLGSGSFLSLVPVCMGKTCEPKDYGRFYGTMNFVVSFAVLITVPIGGQLLESMGSTPLAGLYMAIVTLGGAGLFAARALLVGFWFDMRAKI